MENGCLERNFILAPHPWTLPLNTNLSLVLSAFLPSLAPASSPVNRNWLETSSQFQQHVQYFLIWAVSSEDNQYCCWQRVIIIYQGELGPPSLHTELDLCFGWKHVKGHICASPIFFSSAPDFLVDTMTVSLHRIYRGCIALSELYSLFPVLELGPESKVFCFILLFPMRLVYCVQGRDSYIMVHLKGCSAAPVCTGTTVLDLISMSITWLWFRHSRLLATCLLASPCSSNQQSSFIWLTDGIKLAVMPQIARTQP